MVGMVSYTRITLALDIIRKLTDGPFAGYHELGIVKQRISLGDDISISESPSMKMSCSHPGVPLDSANICWKAVELIQAKYGISQNVHVDINKRIPVQGGLAGGSTNAAAVIQLLDQLWSLGMSYEEKCEIGRRLGMDVPFYFTQGSAFDSEAGGILEPFAHDMKLFFLLVVPPFGVSTADAYRTIEYSKVGQRSADTAAVINSLKEKKYENLSNLVHNDFELSVFPQYPALAEIKDDLLECGADAVFMSGSGSTMVGMFSSIAKISNSADKFSNSITAESF